MLHSQQREPDLLRTKLFWLQVFVGSDHFVLLINWMWGLREQRCLHTGAGKAHGPSQHWWPSTGSGKRANNLWQGLHPVLHSSSPGTRAASCCLDLSHGSKMMCVTHQPVSIAVLAHRQGWPGDHPPPALVALCVLHTTPPSSSVEPGVQSLWLFSISYETLFCHSPLALLVYSTEGPWSLWWGPEEKRGRS